MRILIAPNAFRDCLSAHDAAAAMACGLTASRPHAVLDLLPLSDGGDGFSDVLAGLDGVRRCCLEAADPLGRLIQTSCLWWEARRTAIIEMACISGLRLISPAERNPLKTNTFGTGELILRALDLGATTILLGIGGSATMDGGAGALHALGYQFLDRNGTRLEPFPGPLQDLDHVDGSARDPRLAGVALQLLCDVDMPLAQCMSTFGAQKGALPQDAHLYQKAYKALAAAASKACPQLADLWHRPFLGAGGGLPAGLLAFVGARALSGAETTGALLGLAQRVKEADLVLTGEGALDSGSLGGKLPIHVAGLAADAGKPCYILTGRVAPGIQEHLPEGCKVININQSLPADPIGQAATLLAHQCEQLGGSL